MDELPFKKISLVIKLLRGDSSAKALDYGALRKDHLVRWVELYTVSDSWLNLCLENVILSLRFGLFAIIKSEIWLELKSWYGKSYFGGLLDPSFPCETTLLETTWHFEWPGPSYCAKCVPWWWCHFSRWQSASHTAFIPQVWFSGCKYEILHLLWPS